MRKEDMNDNLFAVLSAVSDKEDMRKLFLDLCTYNEIEQMAQRLSCAELLLRGQTYNQISSEMDVSTATLSRVSRCVRHGSGGYGEVLKKVTEKSKDER